MAVRSEPAPPSVNAGHDARIAIGLSFVAGFVDTVGFVALFGLFTAHVTGNFVLIGAELAQASGSVLLKLLVFPAFILAVALTRVIVLWLEARHRPPIPALLWLQAALLCGFMLSGMAATPIHSAAEPLALAAGLLAATAMGIQNAAARIVFTTLTPTTVMTGNVTQLVIDAVDLARGVTDPALKARSRKFVLPIVTFAIGSIGGAFAYVYGGFMALALPVLVLVGLAYGEASRASTPPAVP